MSGPLERAFETAICGSSLGSGGYTAVKVGNAADRVWGQHLKNLLDRLEVGGGIGRREFFTTDGKYICRVNIDPSDHPASRRATSRCSGGAPQ